MARYASCRSYHRVLDPFQYIHRQEAPNGRRIGINYSHRGVFRSFDPVVGFGTKKLYRDGFQAVHQFWWLGFNRPVCDGWHADHRIWNAGCRFRCPYV